MSRSWPLMKAPLTEALLTVLLDLQWHHTNECSAVTGYNLGGRVHDLRNRGYQIEVKSHGGHGSLYRLLSPDPGPPRHKKVAVRFDLDDARALVSGQITPEVKAATSNAIDRYLAALHHDDGDL